MASNAAHWSVPGYATSSYQSYPQNGHHHPQAPAPQSSFLHGSSHRSPQRLSGGSLGDRRSPGSGSVGDRSPRGSPGDRKSPEGIAGDRSPWGSLGGNRSSGGGNIGDRSPWGSLGDRKSPVGIAGDRSPWGSLGDRRSPGGARASPSGERGSPGNSVAADRSPWGSLADRGSRVSPDSHGEKKSTRFSGPNLKNQDYQEERSKILTMKYGKQQMMLIRKRLKVEMWLMDELETLFEDEDLATKCDMDIDILLDLDSDSERTNAILRKLSNCPATQQETEEFIKTLLEKLATL